MSDHNTQLSGATEHKAESEERLFFGFAMFYFDSFRNISVNFRRDIFNKKCPVQEHRARGIRKCRVELATLSEQALQLLDVVLATVGAEDC